MFERWIIIMRISVAIDGPAGAGKSTIAKLVSKEFNNVYKYGSNVQSCIFNGKRK